MSDEADKIYQAGYDEGLMHGREESGAGEARDAALLQAVESCISHDTDWDTSYWNQAVDLCLNKLRAAMTTESPK